MKRINLSIPTPCHEDWAKMTQVEKGKFCTSCQKAVIDFTNMSDRQIAGFFKKPIGSVCGRFQHDQLNRDLEIPRKRIPWIKYFFQFSLPALLVSMKATAQGKTSVGQDSTISCTKTLGKVKVLPAENEKLIEVGGNITDKKGLPVSNASVMVRGSTMGTLTDKDGMFRLKVNSTNNLTLIVSSIGYQHQEVKVTSTNSPLYVKLEEAMDVLAGEVVVMGYINPKNFKPIPLLKTIVDSALKKLSIYPNPVQANSVMQIHLRKLEAGNYTISVINMAGEAVQTDELQIQHKNAVTDFSLKNIPAGTYFLHVFNRKTALSYAEKIVVQ
jgi:hypothetical protein